MICKATSKDLDEITSIYDLIHTEEEEGRMQIAIGSILQMIRALWSFTL